MCSDTDVLDVDFIVPFIIIGGISLKDILFTELDSLGMFLASTLFFFKFIFCFIQGIQW
jgi:hypothetical protein